MAKLQKNNNNMIMAKYEIRMGYSKIILLLFFLLVWLVCYIPYYY